MWLSICKDGPVQFSHYISSGAQFSKVTLSHTTSDVTPRKAALIEQQITEHVGIRSVVERVPQNNSTVQFNMMIFWVSFFTWVKSVKHFLCRCQILLNSQDYTPKFFSIQCRTILITLPALHSRIHRRYYILKQSITLSTMGSKIEVHYCIHSVWTLESHDSEDAPYR